MDLKRRSAAARNVKRPIHMMGWRENVGLPDLGVPIIKAKIDTGARTSAVCAQNIRVLEGDQPRVAFDVPYSHEGSQYLVACVAPLVGTRAIKNSGGLSEQRYIIKTMLVIGHHRWHVEISLADRNEMGFDLILGRTALRGHKFGVNPAQSFLIGDPVYTKSVKTKTETETETENTPQVKC